MTRYPKSGKGGKWTITELKAIPIDWQGDTLSDGSGLSGEVRLSTAGLISIRFKYAFRWEGKTCWYSCGTFPLNDLINIRIERDLARNLVKQGVDPRTKKKADQINAQAEIETVLADAQTKANANRTVGDLISIWLKDGVNRADGNKYITQTFNKYVIPAIGKHPLRDLSEHHLRDIYRNIVKLGYQTTAVEVSKDVKQMLKWGEKRKPWRTLLIDGNPADLVDINALLSSDYVKERDRILSPNEIKQLAEILSRQTDVYNQSDKKYGVERPLKLEVQIAIWICLSTLCRIGELMKAEWKHVSLGEATWFIPKENAKGGRGQKKDQIVHLSDFSVRLFEWLHRITGASKWLFPATYTDSHVDIKAATKQIGDRQIVFKTRSKKLQYRVENNSLVVGDEEWTPHDLRRTGATYMQKLGVGRDVINLCQNHTIGSKIDRHYLLYEYEDEKKAAWQKLGCYLDDLLSPFIAFTKF